MYFNFNQKNCNRKQSFHLISGSTKLITLYRSRLLIYALNILNVLPRTVKGMTYGTASSILVGRDSPTNSSFDHSMTANIYYYGIFLNTIQIHSSLVCFIQKCKQWKTTITRSRVNFSVFPFLVLECISLSNNLALAT